MAGELVLVIDDSPTIMKVVQLVLTKAGYQVNTAPDGEAGLEAVRAKRPDLILLDFVMPKMNGYQVCRELVEDAEAPGHPGVLMSAKGDQVGERFVKVMGIVDYITKPFSPEAITAVVQHTIGKYGPARGAEEDNPSLVTGEDLAATDDADRAHARSRGAGRAPRPDRRRRLGPRRGAVRARRDARTTRTPRSRPTRRRSARPTRTALDDGALAQDDRRDRPRPVRRGHARPARRPPRRAARRGAPAARRPGADGRPHRRALGARGRHLLPPRPVDQAVAAGVPEEFLLGRFITRHQADERADLEPFLESRSQHAGTSA